MMTHREITLSEQTYAGITTIIAFKDHDTIDFHQLHKDVFHLEGLDINQNEQYMALDSDFTDETFRYTPLAPVNSFEHCEHLTKFIRQEGDYYAFDVKPGDCNPAWFKTLCEYVDEHGLDVAKTDYDLEYYPVGYADDMRHDVEPTGDDVFAILLKKV
jgi:hypothetical protein